MSVRGRWDWGSFVGALTGGFLGTRRGGKALATGAWVLLIGTYFLLWTAYRWWSGVPLGVRWVLAVAVLVAVALHLDARRGGAGRQAVRQHAHLPARLSTDRETVLYELYDSAGLYLYAGIAYDFTRRMTQHANDPDERHWWWRVDMSRTRVTRFPSRPAAKAAETAAITGEGGHPRPLFNRQENTEPSQ